MVDDYFSLLKSISLNVIVLQKKSVILEELNHLIHITRIRYTKINEENVKNLEKSS